MENKTEKIFFTFEVFDKSKPWLSLEPGEIQLSIFACSSVSKLVTSITFSDHAWADLLNFLKTSKNRELIPAGRVAFGGISIDKNEIIFLSSLDVKSSEETVKKLLEENKYSAKIAKITRSMQQALERDKEEQKKYEQGEFLGTYVVVKYRSAEIALGREDFKRFREECIAFEEKRGNSK